MHNSNGSFLKSHKCGFIKHRDGWLPIHSTVAATSHDHTTRNYMTNHSMNYLSKDINIDQHVLHLVGLFRELTSDELRCLYLLACGMQRFEIAEYLDVKPSYVKTRIESMFIKFGINNSDSLRAIYISRVQTDMYVMLKSVVSGVSIL